MSNSKNKPDWLLIALIFFSVLLAAMLLTYVFILFIGGDPVLALTPAAVPGAMTLAACVVTAFVTWKWMEVGNARSMLTIGSLLEVCVLGATSLMSRYAAVFPASKVMIWAFAVIPVDIVALILVGFGFVACISDTRS